MRVIVRWLKRYIFFGGSSTVVHTFVRVYLNLLLVGSFLLETARTGETFSINLY